MVAPVSQIKERAWRILVRLALMSLLLFGVAGCGAGNSGTVQVRVVHASTQAGSIDVYAGTAANTGPSNSPGVAYDLTFGSVTSYALVSGATAKLFATQAGRSDALMSLWLPRAKAKSYTLLIGDDNASAFHIAVLPDQSQPSSAGQVALRIVHQASSAGPLDVYLAPVGRSGSRPAAMVTGIPPGTNSGYGNIPAGIYTMYVMTEGLPLHTAAARYMGASEMYVSGAARTIVLLDEPASGQGAVQAITLDDFTPASR